MLEILVFAMLLAAFQGIIALVLMSVLMSDAYLNKLVDKSVKLSKSIYEKMEELD